MTKRKMLVLAATPAVARSLAPRLGLPVNAIAFAFNRADAERLAKRLPVYVHMSVEGHPKGAELADWVSARWRGSGGRYGWPGALEKPAS